MKAKDGQLIDHKNGNGLDNRKSNLRFTTNRKNQQNRHAPQSSKYAGVRKRGNKWSSEITINKEKHSLGTWDTELEAHLAYLKKLGR